MAKPSIFETINESETIIANPEDNYLSHGVIINPSGKITRFILGGTPEITDTENTEEKEGKSSRIIVTSNGTRLYSLKSHKALTIPEFLKDSRNLDPCVVEALKDYYTKITSGRSEPTEIKPLKPGQREL